MRLHWNVLAPGDQPTSLLYTPSDCVNRAILFGDHPTTPSSDRMHRVLLRDDHSYTCFKRSHGNSPWCLKITRITPPCDCNASSSSPTISLTLDYVLCPLPSRYLLSFPTLHSASPAFLPSQVSGPGKSHQQKFSNTTLAVAETRSNQPFP